MSAFILVDDFNVHYSSSRDAGQAVPPSSLVGNTVNVAKERPWNDTLAVLTTPISFWQAFREVTRVAVYGAVSPVTDAHYTAQATYSIGGKSVTANLTTNHLTVTDFPLFVSEALDPNTQYNLTVDIIASPDAPYLLDYVLGYTDINTDANVTPFDPTTTTSTSQGDSTSTTSSSVPPSSSSSDQSTAAASSNSNVVPIAAGLGSVVGLLLLVTIGLLVYFIMIRRRSSKTNDGVPPNTPFLSGKPENEYAASPFLAGAPTGAYTQNPPAPAPQAAPAIAPASQPMNQPITTVALGQQYQTTPFVAGSSSHSGSSYNEFDRSFSPMGALSPGAVPSQVLAATPGFPREKHTAQSRHMHSQSNATSATRIASPAVASPASVAGETEAAPPAYGS